MSDVIAGLAGGLLALVGGFGIQMLIGRQDQNRRRHELIAAFVAVLGPGPATPHSV